MKKEQGRTLALPCFARISLWPSFQEGIQHLKGLSRLLQRAALSVSLRLSAQSASREQALDFIELDSV